MSLHASYPIVYPITVSHEIHINKNTVSSLHPLTSDGPGVWQFQKAPFRGRCDKAPKHSFADNSGRNVAVLFLLEPALNKYANENSKALRFLLWNSSWTCLTACKNTQSTYSTFALWNSEGVNIMGIRLVKGGRRRLEYLGATLPPLKPSHNIYKHKKWADTSKMNVWGGLILHSHRGLLRDSRNSKLVLKILTVAINSIGNSKCTSKSERKQNKAEVLRDVS